MNIRPFTDDDAPVVAALISAEEERLYGRPGRLTGADILMFLQWSKEEWVWEEDGRMVASATYGVHGDAADIRGIVADKGRGLGAEIIERGEAFARAEAREEDLCAAPEPDTGGACALRVARLSRGAPVLLDGDRADRGTVGACAPRRARRGRAARRRVRGVLRGA